MSSTVFVSLEDIAEFLPPYEEIVCEVALEGELAKAYDMIQEDIQQALRENRGNRSLMSLMLHRLMLYPDHPFGIGEIIGKRFDQQEKRLVPFLVTKAPDLPKDQLYPKERMLVDDIREELRQGRRCQIFATFTGEHDVPERLESVLRQAGFKVAVLRATVPALKREQWYAQRVKEGVEVVIGHPKLVETGLDLLWFPTIHFYETGYSLHTLRQASRRSWRIGQRHPVKVKFLIYEGTTQRTCLRLMGKKMLVALMMEGRFSGEGLHSMDADDDMLAAMARELVEKGGVGESADAVWQELRKERAVSLPAPKTVEARPAFEMEDEIPDMFAGIAEATTTPARGPVLVHSQPKKKEPLWPTGTSFGEQLRLFG
jgi:hypothetical protein